MVRICSLLWFTAALVQAQPTQQRSVTSHFDSDPNVIEDLHRISPLLSRDSLQKRKSITYTFHVAKVATSDEKSIVPSSSGADIYYPISQLIKKQSDANSCFKVQGTLKNADGVKEGYSYFATTTSGSNCDTTAQLLTIYNAVKSCANSLSGKQAATGCCKFSHGGTWRGNLRLSSEPGMFPAGKVDCPL